MICAGDPHSWEGRCWNSHLSDAYLLAALRDREMRDLETCIRNASASVWYGQRHQVNDSPSVMLRGVTKHRLDEKRALAADVAIELGQPELVAELIEAARLQALADTAQSVQLDSDADYDLAGLLTVTGTSLQDVHPVSVGGRSRVAEAGGNVDGPDPLPLEPAIMAVGGQDAVYWGSWAALRKCYWAVRAADGKWSAGALDLGPYADTLFTAESDLRPAGNLQTMAMLEDQEQEFFLNREFGRMVIPPPLADTLKAASTPVSLVAAGAFTCQLPLPALVIPDTSDERLIERAVVRVQPPLVLMKAMPPQAVTAETGGQLIVRIACLDPSGDLPHSRNFDIASETLLTTPSKKKEAKDPPSGSRPATRGNLTDLLRRMKPGEPGIFLYSGHVQKNGIVDGPETSLALADGPLSAAVLSELPVPSHVLLSACSSSGAGGTGAGEWLGLAGSLLRGGARQITATAWPIPDTEFTARFELELITRMRTSGDAAAALRESQLDALTEWRSRIWRPSPSTVGQVPLPRIWAAFQVIGLIAGR